MAIDLLTFSNPMTFLFEIINKCMFYFYLQCPFCSKAFLNSTFLQSHITRRHSEYSGKATSIAASAEEKQVISDSPVLKELQARLEATEAQLQQERLTVCYRGIFILTKLRHKGFGPSVCLLVFFSHFFTCLFRS